MKIVQGGFGHTGLGRIVTVHKPTAAILKFVEVQRYDNRGPWPWLCNKRIYDKEHGRLVLEFGNHGAAGWAYRQLKQAAKMTVKFARESAEGHAKAFRLWQEVAELLREEAEEVQEKGPLEQHVSDVAEALARAEDAAWMAMSGKPEPLPLYGIWREDCQQWAKNPAGLVMLSCTKHVLASERITGGWLDASVREIPHDMHWWLARGVNMVG